MQAAGSLGGRAPGTSTAQTHLMCQCHHALDSLCVLPRKTEPRQPRPGGVCHAADDFERLRSLEAHCLACNVVSRLSTGAVLIPTSLGGPSRYISV